MTISKDFVRRLDDAECFLGLLKAHEKRLKRNKRSSAEDGRAILIGRASIYLIVYNAIEYSIRSSFLEIRSRIQEEAVAFSAATEFWRQDVVQSKFLKKMQDGTNHGQAVVDIVGMIGADLRWHRERIDQPPTSGNFGQKAAIDLARSIPLAWTPPASAKGGIDLETVRAKRNDLAHGLDSFEAVGRTTNTEDIADALARIRIFMVSLLDAIERYQNSRGYLRSPSNP